MENMVKSQEKIKYKKQEIRTNLAEKSPSFDEEAELMNFLKDQRKKKKPLCNFANF